MSIKRCNDCVVEYGTDSTGLCDMCHVDLLEKEKMERDESYKCGCGGWKVIKDDMCNTCNDLFDEQIEEMSHMSQERMDMLYLNSR